MTKANYTGTRSRIVGIKWGETEERSFAAKDKKGRMIGARALLKTATAEEAGSPYGVAVAPAPVVFGFEPGATRNGRGYGASHSTRWFSTEAERAAAIEQYFIQACKRAAKNGKPL